MPLHAASAYTYMHLHACTNLHIHTHTSLHEHTRTCTNLHTHAHADKERYFDLFVAIYHNTKIRQTDKQTDRHRQEDNFTQLHILSSILLSVFPLKTFFSLSYVFHFTSTWKDISLFLPAYGVKTLNFRLFQRRLYHINKNGEGNTVFSPFIQLFCLCMYFHCSVQIFRRFANYATSDVAPGKRDVMKISDEVFSLCFRKCSNAVKAIDNH